MGYIQKFKERFPDKLTPEMIEAFHGSEKKINEFTFKDMKEHEKNPSGILFLSDENVARKKNAYVTKVMLKMGRLVSNRGPARRDDVVYMLTNSPNKDEILKNFDDDPREAFFKAVDHVMGAGNANSCYSVIAQEFYKGSPQTFAKKMVDIRYDAMPLIHGEKIYSYIVFNPKCIQIVKQ